MSHEKSLDFGPVTADDRYLDSSIGDRQPSSMGTNIAIIKTWTALAVSEGSRDVRSEQEESKFSSNP